MARGGSEARRVRAELVNRSSVAVPCYHSARPPRAADTPRRQTHHRPRFRNPELAGRMDAFWSPTASSHALQNDSMPNCLAGVSPRERLAYCGRTMWALLGMKEALAMRTRWAAAGRGQSQGPVIVMRHDVRWSSPLAAVHASKYPTFGCPHNAYLPPSAPLGQLISSHSALRLSASVATRRFNPLPVVRVDDGARLLNTRRSRPSA